MKISHLSRFLIAAYISFTILFAQGENTLKESFEGQYVIPKIDMPATTEGVDIDLDAPHAMNYEEYGNRIRSTGVAIKKGSPVMVTKVTTKKNVIEFQLGGGGFGWKWVCTTCSGSAEANQLKFRNLQEAALHSGSRFNIRTNSRLTQDVLTQALVKNALSKYVDFPSPTAGDQSLMEKERQSVDNSTHLFHLYKGMATGEVIRFLGDPAETAVVNTDGIRLTALVFNLREYRVEARFADNVLVRFSITSK